MAPGARTTTSGSANWSWPTWKTRLRRTVGQGLRTCPKPVQDALRRGSRRLLGALDRVDVTGTSAADQGEIWQSPPVPTPDGMSVADLERCFRSWSVNGEPVGHLDAYVDDSIWRFLYTWGMVREEAGRCLELGANPYFTTYLLDAHTRMELTLANYYGHRGDITETVSFVPPGGLHRQDAARQSVMFNIEEDDFPFDNGSFDVVLFCEMLEHLLMDPMAALRQIHRVLRPGGVLVLTTPNVSRLDNVLAMVNGANIYDPYSGFGPYGRHNREYNRHELHRLLGFAGFDVDYSLTADGHRTDSARWPRYPSVAPLVEYRRPDLGHYLFVRARSTHPPQSKLPSFLYRSRPDGEIVPYD
jgi:SAM-dependent methyltransferase